MTTDTDTPRTISAMSLKKNYELSEKDCPVYENYVHAEVCAEIERELAASKAEVKRLKVIIEKGDFVPSTHYHTPSYQAGVNDAKWAAQDEWYGKYKKERALLEDLYGNQKEELEKAKAEVERLRSELAELVRIINLPRK